MLFTELSRSVWEKTVPLVLSTTFGLWPLAVLKTSGYTGIESRACLVEFV